MSRIIRLTRAKEALSRAIHEIASDNMLTVIDVLTILHEVARPWVCAAEGQQAERQAQGEEE